jgi:hypothetical protein
LTAATTAAAISNELFVLNEEVVILGSVESQSVTESQREKGESGGSANLDLAVGPLAVRLVVILGSFAIFLGYVSSLVREPYREWADGQIQVRTPGRRWCGQRARC